MHREVESGFVDESIWDELEQRVHLHRSPEPIELAVGT
jgi:hypothetical protein